MKREDRKLFSHRFREESIFVHTTDEDINPWDRTRIVAVLVNETGIDYRLADRISEEIQTIIFNSGIRVVTSELVRELVNAKLVEHRFDKARERNRRLGLSLYDVGGVMRYASGSRNLPASPAASGAVMAESLKRQFSLADVFPLHLHRLHLEGRVHIHGIPAPDRVLTAVINGSDLLRLKGVFGGAVLSKPESPDALFRNWMKMDTLLRCCVQELVTWTGMEQAFRQVGASDGEAARLISDWVSLRGAMEPVPGMARTGLHLRSADVAGQVAERMARDRVFSVPVSATPDAWRPNPWLERNPLMTPETTFVVEAVTLNLPGLAIRSIVEDTAPETELNRLLEKVVSMFSSRRVFMEKLAAVRPEGPLSVLTALGFNPLSARYLVGICGLNEWSRVLLNGDMDADGARVAEAERFVDGLVRKLADSARDRRMDIRFGSVDQSEAAYRFARLDLKFQPYYASRVLNGDIAAAAVYYSRDATLPSDKPVELGRKLALESRFQRKMDVPFRTVIRKADLRLPDGDGIHESLHRLLLTADFSLCYNCHTMDSGVYRTCPTCHSTELVVFNGVSYGYEPASGLSPSVREECSKWFFY